jgi:hypothetical protein
MASAALPENDDLAATARLYQRMRTDELQTLKRAFEVDRANLVRAESLSFTDGRLALIQTELQNREQADTAGAAV